MVSNVLNGGGYSTPAPGVNPYFDKFLKNQPPQNQPPPVPQNQPPPLGSLMRGVGGQDFKWQESFRPGKDLNSPEEIARRAAEAQKQQDYYNNRPYQGDHAYKNVFNNYMRSDMYDKSGEGFNPFGENIGGTGAGFKSFLEQEQANIMSRRMQQDVKPQSFHDYSGNINKAYNEFNPITNQESMDEYFASDEYLNNPDRFSQILGDHDPRGIQQRKYDDGYFNNDGQPVDGSGVGIGNMMMPLGHNPNVSTNMPINSTITNPISPTPPTQPGSSDFDSKAFTNDIMKGVGDLFKQYHPEAAQTAFNQPGSANTSFNTGFNNQPASPLQATNQSQAYNPFSANQNSNSFGNPFGGSSLF